MFNKIVDLNSMTFLREFCSSANIFDKEPKKFCSLLVNKYLILILFDHNGH